MTLVENSWRARCAAGFMRCSSVAIVFGATICLWGVSKQQFLQHPAWVQHELMHVTQYRRHGFYGFMIRYLWEWMRNGYHRNKFEVEAREAESSAR